MGDLKGTPQTYLLKKDSSGTWYIVYHHSGAVSSHEVYLKKIEDLLKKTKEIKQKEQQEIDEMLESE